MTVACPVATPQQNVPYNSPLVVSGGTPPYTFSITSGALPNGLTLNTSTGYISGVPTGGPYSYTAKVTDSLGATATTTCSGSQRLPDGGGPVGQTGSCRTIIHLWQLSRVAKPEVIQLRYGDWYDFKQAAYIRGVIIRADTFGFNKQLSIRNSDNNALIQFSGGPSPGIIQHAGEQEIAYYFTPFVSHMVREEPQDQVQWRKFQIEWIYDPWPELTDLDSAWLDLGAQGAKYLRGAVIPMDTNGQPVSLTFLSSDGGTRTVGPFTTTAAEKTAVGWAFDIPLIGHDFQLIPTGPIRVWYEEIRWDFDPWPELIREATGWMPVRPGGGASFLQGLVLPIETDGNLPALSLLTDTGAVIPLTPIVTPPANIKTGVPYSLATPTVCHQVQLLPTSPCRIWLNEIQWVAEATPELAANWITQWTAHGLKGYQHIAWIEVAYAATASATLSIAVQDGTAPTTVTLPSTGGVYQKTLVSLTFNKFMQAQYSLTSTQPLQVFLEDWTVYLGPWGRSNEYIAYKNLGGSFGDKARI